MSDGLILFGAICQVTALLVSMVNLYLLVLISKRKEVPGASEDLPDPENETRAIFGERPIPPRPTPSVPFRKA